MESAVKLYSLSIKESKTWLFSTIFVAGNIILPQICHMIPQGGLIFLPIYFFTLVAAYKYGLAAGVMTAVLSPAINSMLFGMPVAAMLPIIMVKSIILACAASLVAKRMGRISILGVVLAVLAYQAAGSAIEWIATGSFAAAMQDITLGLPGIALQILGGYLVLKAIAKL